MVKSMLAGVSGLRSHQQKMDVIGNNIANVNTWGYKSASFAFKDAFYQTVAGSVGGNFNNQNGKGGSNASQVGGGTGMGSINTSFTTGGMSPSDNPLDCMITGSGFFIVGPKINGTFPIGSEDASNLANSGLSLSRVGIFHPDNEGFLVDSEGNYVYGAQAELDPDTGEFLQFGTNLSPMRVPPYVKDPDYKDAEGNPMEDPRNAYELQSYAISLDGTVSGIDKVSKKTIPVGRIALAAVENPNGLEKDAGYYFKFGPNAGAINSSLPNGGALGEVKSNFLEMSNVDLAKEFSEMITTQRGFQANSKIITVTDEMLQELVSMKR